MARIERDTVSYFPHDAMASSGDTLTILQSRYGNDGYAVWFKLLEKLAATDKHYLDLRNPMRWQLLTAYLGINADTTVEILDLLVEIGAIDGDLWQAKVIWCQKLTDNLTSVYKNRRREIPLRPLVTNNNEITTSSTPITTRCKTQSKVEYSKEEDTIYIAWNNQNIINHQKLTPELSTAIKTALKDYSQEQIIKSIENYAEILNDTKYYFNYKWTLKDFLKRGLMKFLDRDIVVSNYLKGDRNGTDKKNSEESAKSKGGKGYRGGKYKQLIA